MSGRLQNFPISFFTVVIGLAGATIAWQRAEPIFSWPNGISTALLFIMSVIFSAIFTIYFVKFLKYPRDPASVPGNQPYQSGVVYSRGG